MCGFVYFVCQNITVIAEFSAVGSSVVKSYIDIRVSAFYYHSLG